MVSKGRHPKNAVNDALTAAETAGLQVVEVHRGHRWGMLVCPVCGADRAVFSTPRDADTHAHELIRFVDKHRHGR